LLGFSSPKRYIQGFPSEIEQAICAVNELIPLLKEQLQSNILSEEEQNEVNENLRSAYRSLRELMMKRVEFAQNKIQK
jgi:hypothetical protein